MLGHLPDQEDFCPITKFVTKSKIKVRILIFILRGKNKIENIFIPQDWTVVRDPQKRMGPYAYKNSEWVSFDDIDTIGQKIQILKDYKLGGAMIWALGKILILFTKKKSVDKEKFSRIAIKIIKLYIVKVTSLPKHISNYIDLDDFNGQCSPTEYPLLKTINLKLGRISKFKPPKPLVTNKKQNTKTIGSKFIVPYPGFFYYPWNYYLQYQQK